MTSTNDPDHGYKWRRPSISTGIKWGFGALSLIVTISSAAPANADDVTVTLSEMDISVQPVGQPFSLTMSIQKDQNNNVTVDIPAITQTFASSHTSPSFDQSRNYFPALFSIPDFPIAHSTSSNEYPPLPANYPLGGYIDTVDNNIPVQFRPMGGLPIKFMVGSSVTPGLNYTGYIDNQGRLQFSAPDDFPVGVGTFATLPAHVTYQIGEVPDVIISNFQISLGFSDSFKYNVNDVADLAGGTPSYTFDYGDFNDITSGFYDGHFYTTWADNSAQLPGNSPDQPYKSYALAKYQVSNFGKTFKWERIVNLSRTPGGEDLSPQYTYAEGGVTVDPADENTVAVTYQQRKESRVGFVLSRSFDGGRTWTKKLLGLADPNNTNQPLDPNLPIGGTDEHSRFDRFGGLWITYNADAQAPGSPYTGILYLVYSADKGETFHLIETITPLVPSQVPANVRPFYHGIDYDFLATGPDATNLNYDTVWISTGDAFNTCAPNEYQQRAFGLRIKGLGVANIDLPSFKQYVVPGSNIGAWGSMDVDPNGTVYLSLQQGNVKGTYLELLQDNAHSWLNVLEHGLADDSFSNPRYFALSAFGDCSQFPPQPHNNYILPGSPEIAVDKSSQHPGRLYVLYNNRPNINSFATRPYLIWSDDKGVTWSNPFSVSDDPSQATKIHTNIAVDPTTGVVGVSWQDARGSADDTEVNEYGVFLDPRELH
ncbi:MAG: exo-alpha-sialidase [Acidobacteria bacterium]|nr:exo-alpha-sialidase [Acidobacteriota bacterium]